MGNPTLVVGVGGTGNQVVARLEELVGDPAGRGFAFALIDARSAPEKPVRHARFLPVREAINLSSAWHEVKDEIAAWWPPRLQPSGAVTYRDGCGMVRAYGRFFAVYHAPLVVRTITDGLAELARNVAPDVAADTLDCFIVGSLTNGTGAGALHEVALLVRRHAREDRGYAQVRIVGVHLDATAIGGAEAALAGGVPDRRRVANALAALLELQHAYDVRLQGGVPYTTRLQGADGAWFDLACEPGTSPYDYTLLFQGTRRSGRAQGREEAIERAAEALAIWIGGADRTNRALDLFVSVDDRGRFGGMGAARLKVPDRALTERVELGLLRDLVDWMSSPAPAGAGDVLRAADDTLDDLDPDVDSAVRHLVRGVLQVQEAPGNTVNQLFDRFRDDEERLRQDLEDFHERLDQQDEPALVPGLLAEMEQFLDTLDGLVDERITWAEELVEHSLVPALDRWLDGLVGRGALGLARAAVDRLEEDLRLNDADVQSHDATRAAPERRPAEDAWQREREQVVEHASGFLGRLFFRRKAQAPLEAIKSATREELDWWLAHAGVQGVRRVYGRLIRWCESRGEVLDHLLGRLLGDATRKALDELERTAERDLSASGETTCLVGGATVAHRLLDDLRSHADLAPARLAGSAGGTFLDRLHRLLAAREDARRWAEAQDAIAWRDEETAFRNELREAVSAACRDRIRARITLDQVIAAQADQDLRTWHRHAIHGTHEGDREAARKHIASRYDKEVADRLEGLDWQTDYPSARQAAQEVLEEAVIRRGLALASAGWRPATDARVQEMTFAVVHPANQRAVAALRRLAEGRRMMVEVDRAAPRSEVRFLRLELGADIDQLDISPFHDRAYRACVGHRTYEPHVDRRYGHEWPLPGRWDLGRGRRAAALLALAEGLDLVRRERAGVYTVARDLPHPEHGPSLVAGQPLAPRRGRQEVLDHLASEAGADVVAVLKHHCTALLEPGAGVVASRQEQVRFLNDLALDQDRRRQNAPDEHKDSYAQAREGLVALRQSLEERGRLPDWW